MKILSLLAGVCLAAAPAHAAIVNVTFGGTFNTVGSLCPTFPPIGPGQCVTTSIASPFSGAFSYSTDPGFAVFGSSITSDAFAMIGVSTTLSSDGRPGSASLSASGDTLAFFNLLNSQVFGELTQLRLTYPAGTLAGFSPALPLPPFSLATAATFSYLAFASPGGTGPTLNGTVTSFVAVERATAAVPEASTWTMLMVGLMMTGLALRSSRPRVTFAC